MTVRQMNSLRVGDVLLHRQPNGRVRTRVVRECKLASYRSEQFMITVVKQRKSQYPSPVTGVYAKDLLKRDYQPTGKRLPLRSRLDKKIFRHIAARNVVEMREAGVTQDDVVGIIS